MQLGPVQSVLLHLGILGGCLACVWAVGRLVRPGLFGPWRGVAFLAGGSLLLVPFLVEGLAAAGGKVFTDLFYTLILLVCILGAVTAILCWRYGTEAPIAFLSPLVLGLSLGAAFTALPDPEPDPGASWGLGLVHGVGIFLAYACFAAAFAAGASYLLQEASLRGVQFPRLVWRLPSLEASERMGLVAAVGGLVALTVSFGVGMIWERRDGVLGSGWYRDPTILFGGLTWALYGMLVASRAASLLRGRRVALSYVGAFLLVMITFLGTSFVFQGGHRSIRSVEAADHHRLGGGGDRP